MQDFLIRPIDYKDIYMDFVEGWEIISNGNYNIYYRAKQSKIFASENERILIIGDFWGLPIDNAMHKELYDLSYIMKNIQGQYYHFIIRDDEILISTGFLGLYPIFYSRENLIISNSFQIISKYITKHDISERFILESFLFNYPLFDSTVFSEINRLSTHHLLVLTSKEISTKKYWDILELFIDKPSSFKNSYKNLVDVFINTIDSYIPPEGACISFTSGFDGRTIISTALSLDKRFTAFSFGKQENEDVAIPKKNSLELDINYIHIDADDPEYINNEYKKNAEEISLYTGGLNGYLYSHFLYMVKVISKKENYLITGYGGSELLRSTHIYGAITSESLYDIIRLDHRDSIKKVLLHSNSLKLLSSELIMRNIESLVDDILSYKQSIQEIEGLNRKLYYFILNETFRKTFGAWQSVQSKYLRIRSPYMDYNFVKNLLETDFAGIYNKFKTNNPIRRYIGQLLYAHVIKATNPIIYNQKTGKGYKPKDLLTTSGKLKMILPYLGKKLKINESVINVDNLSIISGSKKSIHNRFEIKCNNLFDSNVVNEMIDQLNDKMNEKERDNLLNLISLIPFINHG